FRQDGLQMRITATRRKLRPERLLHGVVGQLVLVAASAGGRYLYRAHPVELGQRDRVLAVVKIEEQVQLVGRTGKHAEGKRLIGQQAEEQRRRHGGKHRATALFLGQVLQYGKLRAAGGVES